MKDFSNLKIGVVGANGRMGLQVQEVLKDYGITCIKEGTINEIFNNADLVIDFSSAEGLEECLQSAQRTGKTLVSGSTPMSDELMKKIQETSKHAKICWSANMSLGIALMKKVAEMLAKSLPENEFDSEILEAHHSQKADAPSGTAVAIGKVIAKPHLFNMWSVWYNIHDDNMTKDPARKYSTSSDIVNIVFRHSIYYFLRIYEANKNSVDYAIERNISFIIPCESP